MNHRKELARSTSDIIIEYPNTVKKPVNKHFSVNKHLFTNF